jgi:hypothetical protein
LPLALASKIFLDFGTHEHIVAYLLKARTVKPEKQPLLGNARTQQ